MKQLLAVLLVVSTAHAESYICKTKVKTTIEYETEKEDWLLTNYENLRGNFFFSKTENDNEYQISLKEPSKGIPCQRLGSINDKDIICVYGEGRISLSTQKGLFIIYGTGEQGGIPSMHAGFCSLYRK